MLTLISRVLAIPGAARLLKLVFRVRWIRALGRTWLRSVVRDELSRPSDVTVVLGVRNRADYRIVNTLRSIRAQTYPAGLVRVVVVDYGSERSSAELTADVCRQFDAEYVGIDGAPVWSRARCLNVGIRRARTKFLMTADVDTMFSPRYLAAAIRALEVSPLSVICSVMLDLPEESVVAVRDAARSGGELPLERWREWCSPRLEGQLHPSIAVTYTALFQLIRGFDEYYEVWGLEDSDLMQRLQYLGLRPRGLDPGSFYLHQWHPKFESIAEGGRAPEIERNLAYFRKNHSILRNDRNWGTDRNRDMTRRPAREPIAFESTDSR
jgi:hypothetical protein